MLNELKNLATTIIWFFIKVDIFSYKNPLRMIIKFTFLNLKILEIKISPPKKEGKLATILINKY